MKALRWYGREDIRLENITEPSPGSEEVKIKVRWCGICGSDLHEYTSGPLIVPVKKPHPITGKMAPITLGHEFCGEIVEAGSKVKNLTPGERVTAKPILPCYQCYWCRKGKYILCSMAAAIGGSADGAFAEYVVTPASSVYKLPDNISDEAGALCEPLTVVLHAISKAKLSPGDTIAVVGAGPIGLLMIQAARATGAGKIFAVEPVDKRRQIAQELQAVPINPRETDTGRRIAELTDGLRADIAFECAGTPSAMLAALNATTRGGTIIEVGQMVEPCLFPFGTLFQHDKSIIASTGYEDEFPTAISFLAEGRINWKPVISARIGLKDIINKGFKELLGEHRTEYSKILVSP